VEINTTGEVIFIEYSCHIHTCPENNPIFKNMEPIIKISVIEMEDQYKLHLK
jgi:hypothetical protein